MDETKNIEEKKEIRIKRDTLKWIIIGLAGFMIIVLVFGLGMFVGANKARFSYRWAENYHKNFGGPVGGFMNNLRTPPPNNEFIGGHGTFGEIIKIGESDLVIKGRENIEKLIIINQGTIIASGRREVVKTDLKVGEQVMVIGTPNDQGQIEAKFIRIFDTSVMMGPMMNI